MSKLFYSYDNNGYLCGSAYADTDIEESKVKGYEIFLLPANSTWLEPKITEGYIPRFTEGSWVNELSEIKKPPLTKLQEKYLSSYLDGDINKFFNIEIAKEIKKNELRLHRIKEFENLDILRKDSEDSIYLNKPIKMTLHEIAVKRQKLKDFTTHEHWNQINSLEDIENCVLDDFLI